MIGLAAAVLLGVVGLGVPSAAADEPTSVPSTQAETSAPASETPADPATQPAAGPSGTLAPITDVTANGVSLTTVDPTTAGPAITDQAATGTVLSSVDLPVTDGFSMAALAWDSTVGAEVTLYLRTHATDGWGSWYTMSTTDSIQAADGALSTDAIWVGPSDGLEVQAIGPDGSSITGLRAVIIDPGSQSQRTFAGVTATAATLTNYLNAPPMVSRAGWGAAAQTQCDTPMDPTTLAVVIHHTAGSNVYTAAEAPGIVRGIQAYHMSLGWCDIGYNFLVDQYGTIYEGRAGGIDLPVHGAHAAEWNDDTVGVSFMMNSETAQPTAAALSSAEQLIAWKLASNYRDPLGTVTIAGKTLPTIFAHRDVIATACPGANIYARMDEIRQAVANIINAATPSPIKDAWLALGGASGTLGQPHRLEQPIGAGRYTEFAKGSIYWSDTTGAHAVTGEILAAYQESGGPTGTWGFPVGDAVVGPNGAVSQQFQNGWLGIPETLVRLSGDDRYATGAAISVAGWPVASSASVRWAVLARGDIYPDALAGGPLAAALNAPLLLTSPTVLDSGTAGELSRLSITNVIILGGLPSISQAVEDQLVSSGYTVERLAGVDRFETAVLIAQRLKVARGGTATTDIFLANGLNFPDALSVSPVAAVEKMPILFTPSGDSALNGFTQTYMASEKPSGKLYVLGSTASVTDAAAVTAGRLMVGSPGFTRIGGADRFATSLLIYQQFESVFATPGPSVVTTGLKFPDALGGGVFAATIKAPLFLVNGTTTTLADVATVAATVAGRGAGQSVYVLGDANSVTTRVATKIVGG